MSLYKMVAVSRVQPCPNCGDIELPVDLQFHWGDPRIVDRYAIGDSVPGAEKMGDMEILAFAEDCRVCHVSTDEMYVLSFERGILAGRRVATPRDRGQLSDGN